MCSSCKMDPHWERVMYERQGMTDPDFGEVEVNYKPKKKKKVKRTRAGCPENNNGPHVYIWVPSEFDNLFKRYFGFAQTERKICCGCLKPAHKSRDSEQYTKKFGKHKRHRWDHPEYRDPGFAEFRAKWLTQHGYTREYYSWLY